MISRDSAQSLSLLLLAVGGLIFGLVPQLLLYFSLNHIGQLLFLLFLACAALVASLASVALGTAWIVRKSGVCLPVSGLRVALIVVSAALSILWYRLINPFPIGPFVENQQYAAILPVVLVLILSWLFFLFILKKSL